MLQGFLPHPYPLVFNARFQIGASAGCHSFPVNPLLGDGKTQLPSPGHGLDRIQQKIQEGLLELIRVSEDRGERRLDGPEYPDVLFLYRVRKKIECRI